MEQKKIKPIEFTLTEEQTKQVYDFTREHIKKCLEGRPFSANGGLISYHITPISIGTCIKVECNCCGENLDITDSENW